MSSVILICGKLCCGKTTYAERMRGRRKAVLLSVDEITLSLFGQHCGDKLCPFTLILNHNTL